MTNRGYHQQYYLKHKEKMLERCSKRYYELKIKCPSCGDLMSKDAKQCHKCFITKNNPSKRPTVRKKIAESKKGPKNPAWRGGKAVVFCSQCGKKLKRWPVEIRTNKIKLFFCNRKCKAKYEAIVRLGRGGPFYKHGGRSQIGICKTCGKKFNRGKGRKAKYCSQKCRPKPGYLYVKGRRFEYKAISVLKKMGFQVIFRSPRSRGIFDIFALRGNPSTKKIEEARYIQVKASRSLFPIKSIVPKQEREKIIKNKMVIMLGENTFYEIWVRRLNKKWDIYRLNWGSKEFEYLPKTTEV